MRASSRVRALPMRTVPTLLAAALLAGCAGEGEPMRLGTIVAGGEPGEAHDALRDYGCTGCHIIPGVRGADGVVGPPLVSFSQRRFIAGRVPNTPESLVLFIMNPQAIKPGSAMPNTGVTDEDARNIAAYLYTLR